MNFFDKEKLSAVQAKEEAQWITFAPFVFQATRVLCNSGILKTVEEHRDGISLEELTAKVNLPEYGVRVLVEAALGIGLLILNDGRYKTTKTAYFILNDELTKVNMSFTHDVCYQGMYFLEESIVHKRPEGLKVFGEWPTIYEALSTTLPHKAKKSWFEFDPDVKITIMDLPDYVETVKAQFHENGFADRISFYPCNILDESQHSPKGFDVI